MKKNKLITALTVATFIIAVVCVCLHLGYNKAIQDAQLINVNEDVYYIQFGNSVHEYSFD